MAKLPVTLVASPATTDGKAGAGVLNWTIVGAASLTLLFQGSTWITEKITLQKYPAYAGYQKTTSRLMPWFPG